MKIVGALLFIVAALMFGLSIPKAHADAGGSIPAPGTCNYPEIGHFGLDGVAVYHYFCAGPTEINGSHWQVVYGGVGANANANIGVSIMMFSASVGISGNVGVIEGRAYWACPDMSQADEPNPVMTWQGSATQTTPVIRSKCKTIAPYPAADLPAYPGGIQNLPPPPQEIPASPPLPGPLAPAMPGPASPALGEG